MLVLSLLMHWPLHAYRIAGIANDIIGPWEKISRGSLSALLGKLDQANYITAADPAQVPFPSERTSHVFAITPAGRDRFHQLMMDTRTNPEQGQQVALPFVSLGLRTMASSIQAVANTGISP